MTWRDPSTVRLQHLAEQADAATRHLRAAMRSKVEREGGNLFGQVRPGPIIRAMLERMVAQLAEQHRGGRPILCGHGRGTAPMLWLPYAPDMLRCPTCATTEFERVVRGRPEERTCDHCRRVHDRLTGLCLMVPATVVAWLHGRSDAVPPILVDAHLCPGCLTADMPDLPNRERRPA